MTYNTASWTNRLSYAYNDLIVRPCEELKRASDRQLSEVFGLNEQQRELVYCILAAIPIAAAYYFLLPPPFGGLCCLAVYIAEKVKPDLLSKRTWATLEMASGIYCIASVPRIWHLAAKLESVVIFLLGFAKGVIGVAICFDADEKLTALAPKPFVPRQMGSDELDDDFAKVQN